MENALLPELPELRQACSPMARCVTIRSEALCQRSMSRRLTIVTGWQERASRISPEGMVESYPAFTLEQVHGALAYYLANQKEIDEYLAQADAVAEIQHQESRRDNAELIAKLRRMRHANQIPG